MTNDPPTRRTPRLRTDAPVEPREHPQVSQDVMSQDVEPQDAKGPTAVQINAPVAAVAPPNLELPPPAPPPVVQIVIPEPPPPPTPPASAASASDPPLQPIVGTPFHVDDVVQVVDRQSRHCGIFFTLGDVKNGKAHGYRMEPGQKKEFITEPVSGLLFIKSATKGQVVAREKVSPKWHSDHR